MTTGHEIKIAELLTQIERNATASKELLELAAEYLEAGEPLPGKLARFLATSIRQAMAEPCAERGKTLALVLGLSAPGKDGRPRKREPKGDITLAVAVFSETVSQTELSKAVRDASKGTEYEIGLSTARTRIQDTKAKLDEARDRTHEIINGNNLKSLVRPRKSKEGRS